MNIIWYGNHEGMFRGWWDMQILEDFFKDEQHFEGMEHFESFLTDAKEAGAIVVLPARALVGKEDQVNKDIQILKWCVLIVAGDEEARFNIDEISHPNIRIWVQNPRPGKHDKYRRIGCGYTPGMDEVKAGTPIPKSLDWFFAGQITQERRQLAAQKLRSLKGGTLVETQGFTQGLEKNAYLCLMADAKVAPCPSGPETPDTFRLYEALELGAVPIADEATPREQHPGYWDWLFNDEVPFPTFMHYDNLPLLVKANAQCYPVLNNRVQAWWINKKMQWKEDIFNDACVLGKMEKSEEVTVVIPVSPINHHPSTSIIEETVQSVRFHFPKAKIIITFDGVRPEQEKLRSVYEEHIRRCLWLCHTWGDVMVLIFEEHTHQVGMMREALKHITTPMLLYVEQDTPMVTDEPIEWSLLKAAIIFGRSNLIRFHFESFIPEAHKHLMIGSVDQKLQKTIQWSQRPHLALTELYRQKLEKHFSVDARCFIEDKLHGAVQDDYGMYGEEGWEMWKMHIYCPNDRNIKRSYHTDGRGKEPKFDEGQVW